MAWRGSLSRSLLSTAAFRSSVPRSVPSRLRPPSVTPSGLNSRRFSLSNPRSLGELGCAQSLMPLLNLNMAPGVCLTSHLAVNLRACCDLFNAVLKDLGSGQQVDVAGVFPLGKIAKP